MEQKKPTETHTVMTKKLAQALMESGMNHFSAGGMQAPNMNNGQLVGGALYGPIGAGGGDQVGNLMNGPHNTQTTSVNGVQPTQSFGQGTADSLGLGGFGRDAAVQMDRLNGMNLYNASAPDITRQEFGSQLAGIHSAQANTYQSQNNLANQLLMQSRGQGPNIAQTQLSNATGQNVQQQGALMASQRGANANPALMARQAAMQGSQIQQSAAGQSAGLQAQQQIAAQQALQGLYQNQASNANQAEQIQQTALANQNQSVTQGALGAQTINANASGQNAQRVGGIQTGLQNSLGGMMGMMSKGGVVPKLSDGGPMPSLTPYTAFYVDPNQGKMGNKPKAPASSASTSGGGGNDGMSMAGGPGDSEGMPGGIGEGMMMASKGGKANFGNYLAGGGVPGKSEVKGNSEKNDKVPALLSPGEVVIDKETLADKGAIGKAARMIAQHIQEKNGEDDGGGETSPKAQEFMKHLKPQKKGYGGILEAKKMNRGGKC